MPNVTIHLDEFTHRIAKTYAARTGTSLSEMFRTHVHSLAGREGGQNEIEVLRRYSRGELSTSEAMAALDISCAETLMSATNHAGLDLPHLDRQAATKLATQVVGRRLVPTNA